MDNILCQLGFHRWKHTQNVRYVGEEQSFKIFICSGCCKRKMVKREETVINAKSDK